MKVVAIVVGFVGLYLNIWHNNIGTLVLPLTHNTVGLGQFHVVHAAVGLILLIAAMWLWMRAAKTASPA